MSELGGGLSSPPTVDEIAAALREDPVLVDDLYGNGDTAAVHEGFAQIVDQAEVETYVVMTQAPAGLSGSDPTTDLATQLNERLGGGDATYVVEVTSETYGPQFVGLGDAPGLTEYFDARTALGEDAESSFADPLSTAGRLARDLETLVRGTEMTSADWDAYASTAPWPEPPEVDVTADPPWTPDALFVPAVLAVVAAGSVWVLLGGLRGLESPRRRSTGAGADEEARATYLRVSEELTALAGQVARDGEKVRDQGLRTTLEGSLDVARRLVDRLPGADGVRARDLPDLLGAQVLERQARRALEVGRRHRRRGRSRRADAETGSAAYRCCFVDPRHGAARHTRALPVGSGAGEVRVPVCSGCRRPAPGELAWLEVPRRLRAPLPYVETDSVWARTGFGGLVDELWREVADDLRTAAGARGER